jgi:hypothetical protein
MAYTQDQLTALELAIAKGERSVSFGDRTVVYRGVDEMLSAMRVIKNDLQANIGGLPPLRQIRVNTSKGF